MKKPLQDKEILTTAQICERLQLSRPVVIQMVNDGKIPALKTGKGRNSRWRFSWDAVQKVFEKAATK